MLFVFTIENLHFQVQNKIVFEGYLYMKVNNSPKGNIYL